MKQMNKLLSQKQAIIFDLDGTLVDSMWMWKAIDIEYLGRFGHECPDDLQKVIEGMSFTETAYYFKERFCLEHPVEQIKKDWTDMSIEKYRCEVPLKAGAREFLEYVQKQGIPMGIATSNSREIVDVVLTSLGIEGFFGNITTGCEVSQGKPAPDVYLKAAGHLNADPKACLVFEDVPAGICAGKAAGMTVIAVEDRFSAGMREEKEKLADYFIETFFELVPQEETE